MIVLDSSAWVEIGRGSKAGETFVAQSTAEPFAVPTVVLYEVLKHALVNRPDEADSIEVQLRRGTIIDFTAELARSAAELSVKHGLSMADAIIYASSESLGARLLTCDAHFEGLPHVFYRAKS